MDSLMEALSTGKAFKKEGRQRRTPRGDKGESGRPGGKRALDRSRSRRLLVSPTATAAMSIDISLDPTSTPTSSNNKAGGRRVYSSMEEATNKGGSQAPNGAAPPKNYSGPKKRTRRGPSSNDLGGGGDFMSQLSSMIND